MAGTLTFAEYSDATHPYFLALRDANRTHAERFPGELGRRQPVHTVYGGAHLFRADAAAKLGRVARQSLAEHAADFITFARVLGLEGHASLPVDHDAQAALIARVEHARTTDPTLAELREHDRAAWLAATVYARTVDKLVREPVEDFRIDFEDGYGIRSDAEEDQHALSAAMEMAKGMAASSLPPCVGIRIKSLSDEQVLRSVRTLDLFLTALFERTNSRLPDRFVVTLPKVTAVEQVAALVGIFEQFERKFALPHGTLQLELMVETTQSIVDAVGRLALPALLAACRGRATGAHFGAYDYTASCGITAAYQSMQHPSCEFARHMMQVALAGRDIFLSDGATNTLPVGPHKAAADGSPPSAEKAAENKAVVHAAWKLHYDNIRHSLRTGFYQGWDLHPAQLPIRYAATYAFFLESVSAATERLRSFIDKAARANLVGSMFDDAASGQGLLNYFARGLQCGALDERDVRDAGLSPADLQDRSFMRIVEARIPSGAG
jgi:HpcH/HpaI aldolase/citrate lyase family